jgi:hypothetical protein
MRRAPTRSAEPVSPPTEDDSCSPSAADLGPLPDDVRAGRSPRLPVGASSGQAGEAPWSLVWDLVDEWGAQSFPASDPPANW